MKFAYYSIIFGCCVILGGVIKHILGGTDMEGLIVALLLFIYTQMSEKNK